MQTCTRVPHRPRHPHDETAMPRPLARSSRTTSAEPSDSHSESVHTASATRWVPAVATAPERTVRCARARTGRR